MDIGRSGPPHCVVLLELAIEVIAILRDAVIFLWQQSLFLRECFSASSTNPEFEVHGIGLRKVLITEVEIIVIGDELEELR